MEEFTRVDELDKSDVEIVKLYLTINETPIVNKKVKSAYAAALIDARNITGRDKYSGQINDTKHASSWAGALTYFSVIDHIGRNFSMSRNVEQKRLFYHALKSFTKLNENTIAVLYALRNAFSHEFNLYNKYEKDEKLNHFFTVVGRSENLVRFPSKKLSHREMERLLSTNDDVEDDRKTVVSLHKLGDLVEEMNVNILLAFASKSLFVTDVCKLRRNLIGYS